MAAFADLVRFLPTLGGTTDWIYSSAVGGCQSPALAGAVNGVKYKTYAVSADLTQWEISEGAYNSGTTTFPRTTVLYNSSGTGTATGQSGAGTKINFTLVPQVSVVALAEDLPNLSLPNTYTDTTEATGAGTTASAIISGGLEVLKKLFVTGIAAFKNTTASTSTTTGAVTVAGGLGVAADVSLGGTVRLNAAVSGTTRGQIDLSGQATVTIANNSSAVINTTGLAYGLLLISEENTVGQTVLYLIGNGTLALVSQSGSLYSAAPTTTPAAGKVSPAYSAGVLSMYNAQGASCGFKFAVVSLG